MTYKKEPLLDHSFSKMNVNETIFGKISKNCSAFQELPFFTWVPETGIEFLYPKMICKLRQINFSYFQPNLIP